MPLSLSYIVVGIIDGGFWTTAVAMQVRESTGTISWGGGFFQTFLNGNLQVWCVFLQNTRTAVVFFHADMLFPLSFACVCIYIYMNSFIKATSNEFWVLWTGRGTSSASRQPEYLRRCHGGAEFVPCGKCHQSMGWSFFDRRSLNNLQCNHHHLGRTLAENCCRPCLNSGVNVEIEKNATVCQM